MKKLAIAAMALTVLTTAPALAQNARIRTHTAMPASTYDRAGYGSEAYAFVPGSTSAQPGVYNYGEYLGWDPDPNIRFQLLRTPKYGD